MRVHFTWKIAIIPQGKFLLSMCDYRLFKEISQALITRPCVVYFNYDKTLFKKLVSMGPMMDKSGCMTWTDWHLIPLSLLHRLLWLRVWGSKHMYTVQAAKTFQWHVHVRESFDKPFNDMFMLKRASITVFIHWPPTYSGPSLVRHAIVGVTTDSD